MRNILVITALCAVLAFGQLPKPGGTTGGGGGGTGDVTAAAAIGDGRVVVGSGGAKGVAASGLNAAVTKMTSGVPSAATYTDLVGLWTTCTGYLKSDGTCSTPDSMVYPVAGVPVSVSGTSWRGTAAASTDLSDAATIPHWTKYTVAYSNAAFLAAATAVSVTLVALPAHVAVEGIRIKHSTAFAGTAVSSTTVSLGDGTTHTGYANAFDIFQATGNTVQYWDGGAYSMTDAAHNLVARFTANTNFGDGGATVLTAGSVDIWVKTAVLP